MMLHLKPGIVHPDRAVVHYPETGSSYLSTDFVQGSPVRAYVAFHDLSDSGTFGDPGLASAEKGAHFFAACVEALALFFADFARWPTAKEKA